MLQAQRETKSNTYDNLNNILSYLNNPESTKITLYATPASNSKNYNPQWDGPETNLPLLAALVTTNYKHIIFDGLFLTATRRPRYLEVKELLDQAVKKDNVFFSPDFVPFTSQLPPAEAFKILLDYSKRAIPLSSFSRSDFFSLLSTLTEKELEI
ncbi:hypothetical protein PAEH1_02545 [Paenalcaligenes hominis]|uniref:Uncharacterized protein n=1 Tax=Paenalcaligenes hominis TaxID=643674 RepID=A0A1U9JY72_9BURK|nr:hypothetical protein [Paenalcaligenes hominis]AQS50706.1 hypothetical protein PAEH1_02545 [Paenalcaligenes hominis]